MKLYAGYGRRRWSSSSSMFVVSSSPSVVVSMVSVLLWSLLLGLQFNGGGGHDSHSMAVVEAGAWHWLFPPKLTLGAFNVQAFGQSKAEKGLVLRVLSMVICRYDVLAIQEIRDAENKVVDLLLRAVNRRCPTYGAIASPRAGSTTSQEQIAYFYRMDTVEPLDTYMSTTSRRFERPPFIGLFEARKRPDFRFLLIAAHLKPKAAADELSALHAVYEDALRHWPPEPKKPLSAAVILGDFK